MPLTTFYRPTKTGALAAGPETISNYGMELSRGFKALKVWMSLKEHGLDKYSAMSRTKYRPGFLHSGEQVQQHQSLELMAAVTMNIVCYRYNPGGLGDDQLNMLNKELLMRMHELGVACAFKYYAEWQVRNTRCNYQSQDTPGAPGRNDCRYN